jgi:hypothetical protein
MTIEIRQPELEALILEQMKSGDFQTVDDLLMEALMSSRPRLTADEIHRRRLLDWLAEAGPGWNPELHPELAEGAAHWVDILRRNDEEIDSATIAH